METNNNLLGIGDTDLKHHIIITAESLGLDGLFSGAINVSQMIPHFSFACFCFYWINHMMLGGGRGEEKLVVGSSHPEEPRNGAISII